MRIVIVGLGTQGVKRARVAGSMVVATVDPCNPTATHKDILDIPPASYDAAYVCTPDDAKGALLTHLLSHGKHILVEKPLLVKNREEIAALQKLAQTHNAICYTAYNHRFEPHIATLKSKLSRAPLGTPYLLRIFYGNGTARDVRNSPWRDSGMGILSDIGSHLLDITDLLFGRDQFTFSLYQAHTFENKSLDHMLFGGSNGKISVELEATMLSWRNTFQLDLLCEHGSAHIECLCKWGPSTLTIRTRILPSGRPEEIKELLTQVDPTWELEHLYFIELCAKANKGEATGASTAFLEKDLWISEVLNKLYATR